MKILFKNAKIYGFGDGTLSVDGAYITAVEKNQPEGQFDHGQFDRVIDCGGGILMPGLYNCHTHAPMTLFRGYGEDLPLHRWLTERIFPAEDLLTEESVYTASKWAIAEMLKNGIVSFSDMYFFCDSIVKAVQETGIKANVSRAVLSFDPDVSIENDVRFLESKRLFEQYHNTCDGRIRIDMALHAEYTNVPRAVEFVAGYARKTGAGLHIHLSETQKEHEECKARRQKTPARFFADLGAFDGPVNAAHCVWVEDEDIALMAECGVSAAHNPVSNLKLGSGVMPLRKMLESGVNVAFGTDGAASNNTLDILKEMYIAAILHKGIGLDPSFPAADTVIKCATENGAKAQGRPNCGKLEAGYKADIILIDLDAINNIPFYEAAYSVLYSANSSNVSLTMVDGRIVYENGAFPLFDFEKLKHDMRYTCVNYFKKK